MTSRPNDLAVVGMACRFPGAPTVEQFWANLVSGTESITRFTDEELLATGLDPAILADRNYVRAKPIIDGVECFDAAFFGLSPREAELTDPQHRVFLEIAAEALERAGLNPDDFGNPIGIFAGAGISTYLLRNIVANAAARQEAGSAAASTGNLPDCLATRVAYKLNLKGPAYSIQCACSTSLVAVHAACQSLLNFECDAALAGGVAVSVPQKTGYMHQQDGVTSADGHCRPFDAQASGTLFGNGAGVVVLMRLDDALKGGYPIAAVIRGSAVNNDGAVKAGFAAPSVGGQAAVIREALANAGLESARGISYVEAHGTATPLGDPVEIAALTQAFRATTDAAAFCAVGAVKGNVGHLDTAGGVAGLIKTVLSLQHRQIPASLHFSVPNPKIEFSGGPFFVNSALRDWVPIEGARRAGVSAFGVGGTNAHVIIEEAQPASPSVPGRSAVILPLSAKSEGALNEITARLAAFISANPETLLADVAHTLQRGRRVHEHRRIVTASSSLEAAAALRALDPARVFSARQKPEARRVAFLFPGQGAQWAGMGRELYKSEPGFRRDVDACCDLLQALLGFDLRGLLFPSEAGQAAAQERLKQTDASQPALFVIEYALARLWMSWGVHPQAMIGHSLGEYVAACLAGVFSLEDALHVVAARGRFTQALAPGEMLAVPLAPDEVRPLLTPDSSIAVINTPSSCVVAGPAAALAAIGDSLRVRGVAVRRLETSHAFHSAAVEDMLPAFAAVMAGVFLHAPRVPFISNVTGRLITAEQACDPQYWVRQTRQTVYFSDGIGELLKDPDRILLEVGPGMTLSTLTRQNLARGGRQVILNSMPDPRERKSEEAVVLAALGRLWLAGIEVDWRGFSAAERRQRVLLPTYPFERGKYWIEPETAAGGDGDAAASRRRNPFEQWFYAPVWKHALAGTGGGAAQSRSSEAPCLVLGDDALFSAALAAAVPGGKWVCAGSPELRSDEPASYAAFFERMAARGGAPATIVEAWGLGCPRGNEGDAFHRLLALAQAWTQWAAGRPLKLVVVSNRGMAVRGDEMISPASSALSGACLVIQQEFPTLTVRCIDLEGWAPSDSGSQVAREVFAGAAEPLVAFRGGLRWIRAFERVTPQSDSPAAARLLKQGGVYLITGGLGGIGLAIAASLAATVRARLVLVGRTALPARAEWPALVAAPQADPGLVRKIRAVQALEADGAQVLVHAADMAVESESRAAVAAALATFGRIDGAIHAAGVAGGGLISLRTREQTGRVFGAKVAGAMHLRRALSGIPVDFIALFSSLAGLTGGVGQADYCAANACLDGMAWNARAENGPFVVSIDWDVWRETGMAVATSLSAALQATRQATLKMGLGTAEGVAAFHRALDLGYPQIAVSTIDLPARMMTAMAAPSSPQPGGPQGPRHPRPDLPEAYVEPSGPWETRLASLWQAVLGFDRIGALDNFFDLGGDSLLALALSAALKREHGCDLSVTMLYEFPTLRRLASQLPVNAGANFSGTAPANSV